MTIRPVALIHAPAPTSDKPISGTRTRRFSYVGTVPKGAIYIDREADRLLPDALAAGDYCHVFGPRQIGKSSLRSRVTKKLETRGFRCAAIDMMGLGSSATEEQWFYALVDAIADKLDLGDPHAFWQRHPHVSPARRWGLFLRHIVEKEIVDQRCILLIDEIEAVRLVKFPTDDFFLILRELYEARSDEPALERLAICLMGVTVPDDLLKEKRSTPYNISRRVRLDDFTRAEMDGLASGFDDLGGSTSALLDAIYAWTDGHPYMTMRTCEAVYQRGVIEKGHEQSVVDAIVQDLFLAHAMDDANLRYASDRFTDAAFDKVDLPLMEKVLLLRRLLDGERVPADLESPVQMELHLCGMVKGVSDAEGQWVRTRNRIFAAVFDAQWLQSRGDRRYLGGALWKWLESGKNKDYLLRGEALMEALARDARLWTDDERAFLVEGLKKQIEFMHSQVVIGRSELRARETSMSGLIDEADAVMKPVRLVERSSRALANYMIVIGLLSLVVAIYEFVDGVVHRAFVYGVVGLVFVIGGGISWRLLPDLRATSSSLQSHINGARESAAQVAPLLRKAAQALDGMEASITALREHLARLTSSTP